MSAFEKIPQHFKPAHERIMKRDFSGDFKKIQDHIGIIFDSKNIDGPSLSHAELATWIGSYAMVNIGYTSYKNWVETVSQQWEETFCRVVWRLVAVMPLGYAFANHSLKSLSNRSFNPIVESIDDFNQSGRLTSKKSNRHLDGAAISQGIYSKIFGQDNEFLSSQLEFAIYDAFSRTPNSDNPFYVAIRNAIRATLVQNPYPVPYFWRGFMFHFLSQSPQDLQALDYAMKNRSKDSRRFELADAIRKVDDTEGPIELSDSDIEASVNDSISPVPEEAFSNKPKQDVSEYSERASFLEQQEEELPLPKIEELVINFGDHVRKNIESGEYAFNAPKSVMHRVENTLCFVYPNPFHDALNDFLNAHGLDARLKVKIEQELTKLNVIRVVDAQINAPTKIIPIKLAQVNPGAEKYFASDRVDTENNPAIEFAP